jgi:outer membrane lipoprotein-sorting protein
MKLSTLLSAFLLTSTFVVAPSVAVAGNADAVLLKLDKDAQAFTDIAYVASMDIYKGSTKSKTLQFEMVMKGLEKQYIHFTAPGDVAGMKVLMTSADNISMYSPEFKKVRKIAAHNQKQGFLGSHFTPEDMAQARLAANFNAEVSGQSGNITTLTLTANPGVTSSFSKLEADLDQTKGSITVIRYYDGSGAVVRTQTRSGWKKISGQVFPTKITMEDHKANGKTVITLASIKVNQGVADSVFTKRTLLRGG